MHVDFHVHSNASDGTFTPTELARKGAAFAAMALTDHDNCDGVEEFLSAGGETPALRFAGIELSIEPGEGFDKFHLLALGIDITNPSLTAFLRRVLEGRNARNKAILANFRRLGIAIEPEDIATYAHGEVLARPHFANWLVRHGHAPDLPSAFAAYLLPDSPAATRCYEERWHPPQEEAFAVVHAAGGVCVMAHPRYWRDDWKRSGVDFARAGRGLAELKEKGLDGLEALYQANAPEENVGFVQIAIRLGLLKSAGSDFHGTNKPAVPLGMEVDEAFIAPLLERLQTCKAPVSRGADGESQTGRG